MRKWGPLAQEGQMCSASSVRDAFSSERVDVLTSERVDRGSDQELTPIASDYYQYQFGRTNVATKVLLMC